MAINDIPQFLKRRFNQKDFNEYLVTSMFEWIDDATNYREFEINVINETIFNYFWDYFKYDFFNETDLDDANQFESFLSSCFI